MSPEAHRSELRAAFERTDTLFALLPEDALGTRPIGLRHPFLFYVGHLPAFAWNQIGAGVLGLGPLHPEFDRLFERGIDPERESEAGSPSAWPTLAEVLAYRDRARAAIFDAVPEVLSRTGDPLCENGRILHLVVEHERMHHETLMYMLAECPPGVVQALPEPGGAGEGRAPRPVRVGAGMVQLGADFDALPFGWDNEFGRVDVPVDAFQIDATPVRNRDWLDFQRAAGDPPSLRPIAWNMLQGGLSVKTIAGPVPFALAAGWPAQVSANQARAYCLAHGGRLPTEAELHHAAFGQPDGQVRTYPWGEAAPEPRHGNLDFQRTAPVPTGSHPDGASAWGVEELVGNGWEWTRTPFGPLPGFRPYARTYPGYSADFFDGDHDVVFGASWATDRRLLRPSFRNWYRRSYPYAFTSFRVVTPA